MKTIINHIATLANVTCKIKSSNPAKQGQIAHNLYTAVFEKVQPVPYNKKPEYTCNQCFYNTLDNRCSSAGDLCGSFVKNKRGNSTRDYSGFTHY